jgi:hypothetical protein
MYESYYALHESHQPEEKGEKKLLLFEERKEKWILCFLKSDLGRNKCFFSSFLLL